MFLSKIRNDIHYFSKTFEKKSKFLKLNPSLRYDFHSLTCMVESRIFRIDPADRVTKEFWQHCLFILKFRSHALGNALMPSGFIKLWRLVCVICACCVCSHDAWTWRTVVSNGLNPPNITNFTNLFKYRISSYSFRGNYSFFKLEIQRSQYIRPKVTVHKVVETIQGRKLFKGGNYMRKYGTWKDSWN